MINLLLIFGVAIEPFSNYKNPNFTETSQKMGPTQHSRDLLLSDLLEWVDVIDPFLSIDSMPRTHNIVADVKMMPAPTNLSQVVGAIPPSRFKRSHLSAVTLSFTGPFEALAKKSSTMQLFASSKLVLMGACTISGILLFVHMFRLYLVSLGWRTLKGGLPQI